jgi:hypothetical protein
MAQFGVVSSSQMARYGRMDAGFHLAINSIAEELAELKAKDISPDACKSQLKNLPLYAYEPLKPLLTGNKAVLNRAAINDVIEKYPLESWLLVKKGISTAHDTLAEKEKELERERQALRRFF